MGETTRKVNIHTEWGRLKEVILGNCFNLTSYNVDLSFKLFFHENLKDELIKNSIGLQKRIIERRSEDLDGFAKVMESAGVKVLRPKILEEVRPFSTPYFDDHLTPCDHPRDQVLIYRDQIIETSPLVRARFFENDLMKDIFYEYFRGGSKWISSPFPMMKDESFDKSYVSNNGKEQNNSQFEIMFDGAQCLKFGNDIIMNVSTKNHELGALWLERHLGKSARLHRVRITDNHIDSMLMPLRPGLMLVNSTSMLEKMDELPKSLQKWDKIIMPANDFFESDDESVRLASANIGVNVLPLSPDEVIIFGEQIDHCAPLARELEKKGMIPIPIQLRHSRIFGGGAHCVTLDTVRDDAPEDYFK